MAREIRNAEISFVSLVKRAANKKKFLIIKQEGGESTMTKAEQKELNDITSLLTEIVVKAVIKAFEEMGYTKDGKAAVEKSDKHYLKGIL